MSKRTRIKCKTPGVRYREHSTRKHGVRPDRYFFIRYKLDGKDVEEGLGWSSEGMTEARATKYLSELREAQRTGDGERTLSAKRENQKREEEKQAEVARAEQERLQREKLTFRQYFEDEYLPSMRGVRKPESIRKAESHVQHWLGPVIGNTPLLKIKPKHLEKVRSNMAEAGKAARTQQYVMATFRAVWNKARNHGHVFADSPSKAVELPKVSNTRQRYLRPAEADALLDAIKRRSLTTWRLSLLSLHTGLRFGECCNLTWGCVDQEKRLLHVLNAKGDKDRTVNMTQGVYAMFQEMPKGLHNELVFQSRKGGRIYHISKGFDLAVAELGLNNNVTDPKQRFTFHGFRHTHASWMIESGVGLYVVQRQLGHSTPVVTQRYSHVSDEMLQQATQAFESGLGTQKKNGKVTRLADHR